MNELERDLGTAASVPSRDPACDDTELLRRIGQGDADAMACFYRKHGRIVLAQVLLVVGDRVIAEEILQDTMLAVWRGRAPFVATRRCVPGSSPWRAGYPGPAAWPATARG